MTIETDLAEATENIGGTSARLDAEVLLAHVLGIDRSGLLARPELALTNAQREHFQDLIGRRQTGQPIAQLVGYREFYGRRFAVNPAVLVPRPESELLVELALSRLADSDSLVDIGTGSGCLGVTLALERPDLDVHLVDLSAVALSLAADNATRLGANRVRLHRGDLWPELGLAAERTVVVANLPYVTDVAIDRSPTLRHEPRLALSGGSDGLEVIRRFVAELSRRNFWPRTLLLEHGPDQAAAVRRLVPGQTQTHADLAGHPRVTEASALTPAGEA